MRKIPAALAAALSVVPAVPALAVPFNTFDPVSMGRGGVGVAMPNPSNATLFNPAQLSAMPEQEDYAVGISAGVRAYDPDETMETLDDASDTIDRLDALANQNTISNEEFDEIARLTRELNGHFNDADRNVAQIEAGGALLISRPSKSLGFGLTGSAQLYIGGTLDYTNNDNQVLNDLADDAEARDTNAVNEFDDVDLNSEARVLGAAIGEVGVTLSRAFTIGGREYAFGITPKSMEVETIYYAANINDADSEDFDADEYRTSYSDPNFDIGALTAFGNLHAGLTIKNLISREYETAEVNGEKHTIELEPQARLGFGYEGGWYRLGTDIDLTTNAPVAFEDESRFVAVGGELDAWGWAQLRAGYRANSENSDRNVASLGLGLSPFRVVHVDLAVAGNDQEAGAAVNLSLTF